MQHGQPKTVKCDFNATVCFLAKQMDGIAQSVTLNTNEAWNGEPDTSDRAQADRVNQSSTFGEFIEYKGGNRPPQDQQHVEQVEGPSGNLDR
jgi:hypothetical protein